MLIKVERFYGDDVRTLSRVRVFAGEGDGVLQMECGGMEPRFGEYTKTFEGVMGFCLPAGTFDLGVKSGSRFGVWGLSIKRAAGHLGAEVGHRRCAREGVRNVLLVGEWDGEQGGDVREWALCDGEQTFRRLEGITQQAYCMGEKMRIEIVNKC